MSSPLTLRITRRATDRLRTGHLWVYRTDIEGTPADIPPGALVTITDSRALPLGTALYSTASTLAARLISPTPALTREQYLADLRTRIDTALQRRRELAPNTNAHRLIFSEADNLPGIVADRYNDLVLIQLLTQGTAQDDVRATLVEALRAGLSPNNEQLTIWERPDPRIRELEQLPAPPFGALYSTEPGAPRLDSETWVPPTTTTFTLNNLQFHYDASAGQKTGAFLDQRLNYAAAARAVAASGRTNKALDICTYHGGFALHLAEVCAQVTGVDASRSALEAADRNLLLNPSLTGKEVDWIEADAFDYLRYLDTLAHPKDLGAPRLESPASALARGGGGLASETWASTNPNLFSAIVLDPPAFAKSKRAAEGALRGYKELNLRAIRLLEPGGTLITNSCSHHVSLADFTEIVAAAAADTGRRLQLLETRAAAPDHPEVLTLPETRYLKCLICRID
jgi:23S rRNA (cytosine1962-C5)-methyltransferase